MSARDASATPPAPAAIASAGGREITKNVLYVGNLDKAVTEACFHALVAGLGPVRSVKFIADKNKPGFNYAFVAFASEEAAARALDSLHEHVIHGSALNVNYAYQLASFSSAQSADEQLFNVFVGDLLLEVDDEALTQFFAQYPSLAHAHVMWDMLTSRSRGYGFASFRSAADAEQAIVDKSGSLLCGRAIRCNWAAHKKAVPRPRSLSARLGKPRQSGIEPQGYLPVQTPPYGSSESPAKLHTAAPSQRLGGAQGLNRNASLPRTLVFTPTQSPMFTPTQSPMFTPAHSPAYVRSQSPAYIRSHSPAYFYSQGDASLSKLSLPGASPYTPSDRQSSPLSDTTHTQQDHDRATVISPSPPALTFADVVQQAPLWQTTVYLGNLLRFTQQNDLLPLLQNFGYIVDFKLYPEKGCAFVKYDTHECAAVVIVQLSGFVLHQRPMRCGWGRARFGQK